MNFQNDLSIIAVAGINDYCELIRDTLVQEGSDFPNRQGVTERIEKYLGPNGLQGRAQALLTQNLPQETRRSQILGAIQETKKCRAWVLDAAEQAMAPSSRWHIVRGRLLKYFGHRGIEGILNSLLECQTERG